ncbi:MAG: flavin reductase family protein [Verrucomicrobiae bacterium]|nr:flavin reductase family protein [Verrucomicrobiae bacterium]
MVIDFDQLSSSQAYFTMTQAIIPRPIAWVLSDHGNGKLNLAPFSYFNAVCSRPPMLSISIGHKKSGLKKDTWVNIEERSHFVVHIPNIHDVDPLLQSSRPLDHGISEVEDTKLGLVPFDGSPLPRVESAPVAFYCEKHSIVLLGDGPQALVLGKIKLLFLDDKVASIEGDSPVPSVSAKAVNPLARLGADGFASIDELKGSY